MAKKAFSLSIEIVGLILVIVLALVGFYINSNDKEVNLLNNEIDKLRAENENLRDEIDPNWHSKFNNQRQFYEAELSGRDKELLLLRIETDSLAKIRNYLKHKDFKDLIYTLQVADSLISAYEREIESNQQVTSSQDNLIRSHYSLIRNLEQQVDLLKEAWDNSRKLNDLYSKQEIGNKIMSGLNVILFILILVYFHRRKRDLKSGASL